MKIQPLLCCLPLLISGCSSQDAAGLATVSAVAIGGALSPVGEVYHAVSGDREKMRAKIEAINARFDPICEKKIAAISSRDPIADANSLYRSGVVALLPSIPGLRYYPGLEVARYDLSKIAQNPSAATDSTLYLMLEALMNPESEDFKQQKDEPRYYSPVFSRFIKTAGAYKVSFNREIYRLETESEPNQAPEPTPTAVTPPAGQEARQP